MKKQFIVTLLILLPLFNLLSEDIKDKMLTYGNPGKEFWFTVPPVYDDETNGFLNHIRIYVISSVKAIITCEIQGKGYYSVKNSIPNDVIEFNITPLQAHPYVKKGFSPEIPDSVFPGSGIHVWSDQPFIVYCMVYYHWTSEGFLVYPTSVLGKEYIISGYSVDPTFSKSGLKLPNITGITAAFNDTKMRFTMGGNVFSKTAGGLFPGSSVEVTLNQGDVYMVSTIGDGSDLSGSIVESNKPVSVVTSNMCANIPNRNQWCNYIAEMQIPTLSWGLNYHIPILPNRKYSSIIRIYAKESQTKFFRDGKQIGFLKKAGGIEGEGWLEMRMVPMDQEPRSVVISGDKAIAVTLYNTGIEEDNDNSKLGDPFSMSITPYELFNNEITFFMVPAQMGYNQQYLNLIFETDGNGNIPDEIEFGSSKNSAFTWENLGSKFQGKGQGFMFNINGKELQYKTLTLTGNRVYKIRSKTKLLTAYLFGFTEHDSYGFPVSSVIRDLEKRDSIPPDPKWIVEYDGSVKGATIKEMPDDPKVRSNLALIYMRSDSSYNYSLEYDPFIPGETRTTNWKLSVGDLTKDARAVITFYDRAGNDTTITIDFISRKIRIEPPIIDFGMVRPNANSVWKDIMIINNSDKSQVVIVEIKLKWGTEGFLLDLSGIKFPYILKPSDSLLFRVKFTPNKLGDFRDSVGVGDSCIFINSALLSAKVVESIIDVSDIDFGTLSQGEVPATKDFLINNTGQTGFIITGYSNFIHDSVYSSTLPVINSSNPLYISKGTNKQFRVIFDPKSIGSFSDRIVFYNDATRIDSICLINANVIVNSVKDEFLDDLVVDYKNAEKSLKISFVMKNIGEITYSLHDISGKMIMSESKFVGQGLFEDYIKIPNITSGVYILKISGSGGIITRKISIIK